MNDDRVTSYELAQVNIGRLRRRWTARSWLASWRRSTRSTPRPTRRPGFVWRLQTEDGNATAVRAFEWDRPAARESS